MVVRKCHLYELLVKLEQTVDSLAVESTALPATNDDNRFTLDDASVMSGDKAPELDDDKAAAIVDCLEEITFMYRHAADLLVRDI